MSEKLYRIWTTPKDGSENGRWDSYSTAYPDKEKVEKIAKEFATFGLNENYEVREYPGDQR
jgi:hypothetical protein